jgi:predicted nuclease of predicted toxin-antitoxin system
VKPLIDESLHTSLVSGAHSAGHSADHVSHRGLGGLKDWQLMRVIREQEYTFVTNNRSDFLSLHGKKPLHAGVIVIVPNVVLLQQQELFTAALKHIGTRDLTNTVVEVRFVKDEIQCRNTNFRSLSSTCPYSPGIAESASKIRSFAPILRGQSEEYREPRHR